MAASFSAVAFSAAAFLAAALSTAALSAAALSAAAFSAASSSAAAITSASGPFASRVNRFSCLLDGLDCGGGSWSLSIQRAAHLLIPSTAASSAASCILRFWALALRTRRSAFIARLISSYSAFIALIMALAFIARRAAATAVAALARRFFSLGGQSRSYLSMAVILLS